MNFEKLTKKISAVIQSALGINAKIKLISFFMLPPIMPKVE